MKFPPQYSIIKVDERYIMKNETLKININKELYHRGTENFVLERT